MKWIRNYKLFKEALETPVEKPIKPIYSNKNLIQEICVSMILLNNNFLNHINHQKLLYNSVLTIYQMSNLNL